jgi:hypothetical protein
MNPSRRALIVLLAAGSGAARAAPRKPLGKDRFTTRRRVIETIERELRPGSSAAEIESFYRRHQIDFSYYDGCYYAIIRDVCCWLDHAIHVDIDVDVQRRFVRARVEDSYTFL